MLLMLTMLTQSRSWITTSTEILLQKDLIKTVCQKNFNGGNLQIFQTKQSNKLSTVNKNMGCTWHFSEFSTPTLAPSFLSRQVFIIQSKTQSWRSLIQCFCLKMVVSKENKVLKPLPLWAEWLCLSYRLTWIKQSV